MRGGAGGRGGEGPSIGGIYSGIPAAIASTTRIVSSISLSGLRMSVSVYSTIFS